MDNKQLTEYLSGGIENIIKTVLFSAKESKFILSYMKAARNSASIRKTYEENGIHIPPFLIASITSSCNLHCAGCYARGNHSCHDGAQTNMLSCEKWDDIFMQAEKAGIAFILLAGGEPLMRKDVIIRAAAHKNIVFPIFTNGTMLSDEYINLFDLNRNLIPVISMEGDKTVTDKRRGNGVYEKIESAMKLCHEKHILFGTSITVTSENIHTVTSERFISEISKKGCRLIIYVEYVPVNNTDYLTLSPENEDLLKKRTDEIKIKLI